MKYCPNCGKETEKNQKSCPECGYEFLWQGKQEQTTEFKNQRDPHDAPSTGIFVLSFLFSMVGILLYFIFKEKTPQKAESALRGSLAAVSFSPLVGLILYLILKEDYSSYSKLCGKSALIGVIIMGVLFFCYIFMFIVASLSMATSLII